MTASTGRRVGRRVLIIVENLPVPFDRRVWQEARTLAANGYGVSVICPKGKGHESSREDIEGIHIYRHPLPLEARGGLGYLLEYGSALFWQIVLSLRVLVRHNFDVIHACNPPDTIFLVGAFYKVLLRKRFIFDHHDLCPELYEAKFGRRGTLYRILCWLERSTFRLADVSIATNESYKRIAMARGGKAPQDVFVVRSGPRCDALRAVPPVPELRRGRRFLVAYVGVIGKQEGLDYLMRAIDRIVHRLGRNDIHFGIVGDGPELSEIKRLAQSLKVDDYVTFTGRIPDGELLAMLSTADVCVNPDEFNEMNDKSTMNKIMEYMALGRPIVQFEMTEGRFSAQQASLYARPNDADDLADKLIELLDDPDRRAAMGAFGEQRLRSELAWDYQEQHLLAAYEAAFAPRRRRAAAVEAPEGLR